MSRPSTASTSDIGLDGLSRKEMIGLIGQYRGKDDGLVKFSTKRLQMLLKFYEVSALDLKA